MENFTFGGKTVIFEHCTGIVLSAERQNQTHISTSGGGGFIHNGGGHINPTRVHSTIQTNQQFWIQTSSGKEVVYKFKNSDIPLRAGQKITVVTATVKNASFSYRTMLVNHSSEQYWTMTDGEELNKGFDICQFGFRSFCILACVFFLVGLFGSAWLLDAAPRFPFLSSGFAWMTGGLFILAALKLMHKEDKADQLMATQLKNNAQWAFKHLK